MQTPAGREEPSITHNITHFCASVINETQDSAQTLCAPDDPSPDPLKLRQQPGPRTAPGSRAIESTRPSLPSAPKARG